MALSLSIVHSVVVNLFLLASAGLPRDDVVHGVGLSKGQDLPQCPLRHLKLVLDVLEGDLVPPQPKSTEPPFWWPFQSVCLLLFLPLSW